MERFEEIERNRGSFNVEDGWALVRDRNAILAGRLWRGRALLTHAVRPTPRGLVEGDLIPAASPGPRVTFVGF